MKGRKKKPPESFRLSAVARSKRCPSQVAPMITPPMALRGMTIHLSVLVSRISQIKRYAPILSAPRGKVFFTFAHYKPSPVFLHDIATEQSLAKLRERLSRQGNVVSDNRNRSHGRTPSNLHSGVVLIEIEVHQFRFHARPFPSRVAASLRY